VDILPTLLHLAGREIPAWCEGDLLPGLGGQEDGGRVDFAIQAQNNPAFDPLAVVTMVMRRGKYKMIYYTGYEVEDAYELYDLEGDAEEMNDLYSAGFPVAALMREELRAKLQEVNRPYERG
jgi:arylsulfatase A-like enzyme